MEKRLELKTVWCKGCGICVEFCPRGVLALQRGKTVAIKPESCVKCGICESLCPDFAIYIVKEGGEE